MLLQDLESSVVMAMQRQTFEVQQSLFMVKLKSLLIITVTYSICCHRNGSQIEMMCTTIS